MSMAMSNYVPSRGTTHSVHTLHEIQVCMKARVTTPVMDGKQQLGESIRNSNDCLCEAHLLPSLRSLAPSFFPLAPWSCSLPTLRSASARGIPARIASEREMRVADGSRAEATATAKADIRSCVMSAENLDRTASSAFGAQGAGIKKHDNSTSTKKNCWDPGWLAHYESKTTVA